MSNSQMTPQRLAQAVERLREYKRHKEPLERRILEEELWWQGRQWEVMGQSHNDGRVKPTSAWLFNNLANKHADAMDNYPEPNVLPREKGDTEDAELLGQILPVVFERSGFEGTYSDNWWYKLKHGTAVYGVFWNRDMEQGMGDIDMTRIDLLNLFWEPGVSDIQSSRDLFIAEKQNRQSLIDAYPQHKTRLSGDVIDVITHENADDTGKITVIDWYYKVRQKGRSVLHYCKFAGDALLYSSEDDPHMCEKGWYDHGRYPVVLDTLFPIEGQPVGFGYIAVTKSPQEYIDRLGQNILESSLMGSRPRYFAGKSAGINEEQFLDWSQPIVHVEGAISEERLRPLSVSPLPDTYLRVQQMKIEELKETSSNRDFSAGGVTAGVTAASAIAALQEAGNKTSRDMISAAYRAYVGVAELCIELVRQFYGSARTFRITGEEGGFLSYSNKGIAGEHSPVFDIKVRAQKKNPFSRMGQNELAKELYRLGFFKPELKTQALGAIELMDFEGKDRVREYLSRQQIPIPKEEI